MKNKLPSTEKIIPYIIFLIGILYGLGFAIDWNVSFKAQLETEKSAWDIVAAIGSFLGGIGTIGLLFFGIQKSENWLYSIKKNKKLDLTIDAIKEVRSDSVELYNYIRANIKGSINQAEEVDRIKRAKLGLPYNKNDVYFSPKGLNPYLTQEEFLLKISAIYKKIGIGLSTLHPIIDSVNREYLVFNDQYKRLGKELKNIDYKTTDLTPLLKEAEWFPMRSRELYWSFISKELE